MKQLKISPFKKFWSALFKHKLKPYIVDSKYRVVPAFSIGGTDYFMFDSAMEIPTGRFFWAMNIYKEMEMGVDKAYLESFTKAIEKVLSDKSKLSIYHLVQMNIYLKERLELAPMPEFIYKLASVVFFDKSESIYAYDLDYNIKKIAKWKAAGGTLDFFSRTPLVDLIPSLNMPEQDSLIYSQTMEAISKIHREHLTGILSGEPAINATNN